jgi:hypothetical protein
MLTLFNDNGLKLLIECVVSDRKDLQVIAEERQEGLIDGESCPIHSVNVPCENIFPS